MSQEPIFSIMLWVIVGIFIIFLIVVFNRMVSYYQSVKSSKSSIQVELKKRLSLIPQVVETAKKFLTHEKEMMQSLTKMRQNLETTDKEDISEVMIQEKKLFNKLFAVAEAYPDLKSSETFVKLQNVIQDTEENIAASRHVYNSNTDIYNSYIRSFPALILASLFGYKNVEYLEFDDELLESDPDIEKLFAA